MNRKGIRILSLVLIAALSGAAISYFFGRNISNAKVTSKEKTQAQELTVLMSLKGGSGVYVSDEFKISDKEIFAEPKEYNHNLALASFGLAASAFSAGDTSAHWGDDGNFGREASLKKCFDGLALSKQQFVGYDVSLNSEASKAAFGIGLRKFNDKYLVIVSVRGGGYGAEWADNFKVGNNSDYHEGFETAANRIIDYVESYVSQHCQDSMVRLWITGYSRGAAIANIASSKLSQKASDNISVVAYTFATPLTTVNPIENQNNIFNIINPYDAITAIPPSQWGFKRAGYDFVFPLHDGSEESQKLYDNVVRQYHNLTGSDYNMASSENFDMLTDIMLMFSQTREDFSSKYEPVFRDLVQYMMTKSKVGDKWQTVGFSDYFIGKYGNAAKKAISKIFDNEYVIELNEAGVKIPKEVLYVMTIFEIHGITNPEEVIINSADSDIFQKVFSAFSKGGFTLNAKSHYPETYLAWLRTI